MHDVFHLMTARLLQIALLRKARRIAALLTARQIALLLLPALLASAGCLPVPAGHAERGLYVDLRRGVGDRESDGWGLDHRSVEDVASATVESACAAGPRVRERVARWLDGQITGSGGIPATGARLLPSKRLHVARVRAVLRWWDENADECASFGPADPNFRGIESDDGRFVVIAEIVLGLAGFVREGRFTMGPGLGYRMLPAYGITSRLTVGVGIEAGALTEFRPDTVADDRVLAGRFMLGVPVLVRFLDGATVFDLEAAVSTRLDGIEPMWPPGFRFALGYGSAGMRVNGIMSTVVFWTGYEYQPPRGDMPAEHILRAGTRLGFDLAP